jgi:hypothetical protein
MSNKQKTSIGTAGPVLRIFLQGNETLSCPMPGIASMTSLTPEHAHHGTHIEQDCFIPKDTYLLLSSK